MKYAAAAPDDYYKEFQVRHIVEDETSKYSRCGVRIIRMSIKDQIRPAGQRVCQRCAKVAS